MTVIFGFLALVACSVAVNASELPIGISPTNGPFYVPSKPFTCLDNSVTIPWSKVNDDYCDCRDGSDEPGTSACLDMKFYCNNGGHEGNFISSSFVNDMYCDCCDGSDEYLGYISCPDTCGLLAKEKEEERNRKRKDFESGHETYKTYVAKKSVELVEQAKREAEEAAARAKEEEEERQRRALEDSTRAPEVETTSTPITTSTPLPDSAHAPKVDESVEPESDDHISDDEPPVHHDEDEDSPIDNADHAESFVPGEEEDGVRTYVEPPPPAPIDYGPDNGFMMLTEPDIGCLELEQKEYVYSLCAFKDARQRNRHEGSGGGTLLGRWAHWVGHPEDSHSWDKEAKLELPYDEMLYDGGNGCWNGPNRSAKVKIICGGENKLLSVDEPSRCFYEFRLQTPAACHHHPDKLMEMHVEL